MLANVGHYLRGLSDRVKVLPVARTGPLRVAAEAVSAPVEAVPRVAVVKTLLHDGHDDEGDSTLYIHSVEVAQMSMCGGLDHLEELAEKINKAATTSPQVEPSPTERCKTCDGTGDVHDQTGEWRGECTACDVATVARLRAVCRLLGLETAVPSADATLMGCLFSVLGMIRRVIEQRAGKTENEIDRLETEVARLTAELQEVQEVRKDAVRLDWLLPNLHPATWGMEFPGGYEWGSPAELLAKWRAAIDAELATAPEAPKP
jgi:hypothetical protein